MICIALMLIVKYRLTESLMSPGCVACQCAFDLNLLNIFIIVIFSVDVISPMEGVWGMYIFRRSISKLNKFIIIVLYHNWAPHLRQMH